MIPSKQFMHQGTMYFYTGDEVMADSHFNEVRNHLLNMKRINVNNLPIDFGQKRFDDGTVALFQFIHGKETVRVISPVRPHKAGHDETDIAEIRKIVPCIRSGDNKYWVACLSGTFEGPYYLFENKYEIPMMAFDDNVEIDLDKQLISIGKTPIEDSIDDPELRFVAQTGVRPASIEWSYDAVASDDYSIDLLGRQLYLCDPPINGGSYEPMSGIKTVITSYSLFIWGDAIHVPPRGLTVEHMMDKDYYDFFINTVPPGSLTMSDVEAAAPPPRTSPPTEGMYFSVTGLGGEHAARVDWHTTSTEVFCELWEDEYSIRLEQAIHTNMDVCYRLTTTTTSFHEWADYEPCQIDYGPIHATTEESTTYCDYFKLDSRIFPLRLLSGDYYPTFNGRGLKYYNTKNIARITGIMAAAINHHGSGVNEYGYYYVGPNSKDDLSTTKFPYATPHTHHTIPKMTDKDDNPIEFYGEIFLGLVTYNVETRNESFRV